MPEPAPDFETILREELGRIERLFAADELAFLALTSKVELPVRDRLAYALYQRLPRSLVAREWKRVDLAVLAEDGKTPQMLLEAKALFTFDLIGDEVWVDRYPMLVRKDVAALRARSDLTEHTQLFALVLATHPLTPAGPHLREVAKYSRGVAKAIGALGTADAVFEQADAAVRAAVPDASEIVDNGRIPGGSAYGVQVDVPYWLISASRMPPHEVPQPHSAPHARQHLTLEDFRSWRYLGKWDIDTSLVAPAYVSDDDYERMPPEERAHYDRLHRDYQEQLSKKQRSANPRNFGHD